MPVTCFVQNHAFARLTKALGLPGNTSSAVLTLDAGSLATLEYKVLVTEETIDSLAELFDGDGLKVGDTLQVTRLLEEDGTVQDDSD
jgi:hypothetical protein